MNIITAIITVSTTAAIGIALFYLLREAFCAGILKAQQILDPKDCPRVSNEDEEDEEP